MARTSKKKGSTSQCVDRPHDLTRRNSQPAPQREQAPALSRVVSWPNNAPSSPGWTTVVSKYAYPPASPKHQAQTTPTPKPTISNNPFSVLGTLDGDTTKGGRGPGWISKRGSPSEQRDQEGACSATPTREPPPSPSTPQKTGSRSRMLQLTPVADRSCESKASPTTPHASEQLTAGYSSEGQEQDHVCLDVQCSEEPTLQDGPPNSIFTTIGKPTPSGAQPSATATGWAMRHFWTICTTITVLVIVINLTTGDSISVATESALVTYGGKYGRAIVADQQHIHGRQSLTLVRAVVWASHNLRATSMGSALVLGTFDQLRGKHTFTPWVNLNVAVSILGYLKEIKLTDQVNVINRQLSERDMQLAETAAQQRQQTEHLEELGNVNEELSSSVNALSQSKKQLVTNVRTLNNINSGLSAEVRFMQMGVVKLVQEVKTLEEHNSEFRRSNQQLQSNVTALAFVRQGLRRFAVESHGNYMQALHQMTRQMQRQENQATRLERLAERHEQGVMELDRNVLLARLVTCDRGNKYAFTRKEWELFLRRLPEKFKTAHKLKIGFDDLKQEDGKISMEEAERVIEELLMVAKPSQTPVA